MDHDVAKSVRGGNDDILREIDAVLDGIADLVDSKLDANEFYRQLLQRASLPIAADAAAICLIGPGGQVYPAHHVGLTRVFGNRFPTKLSRECQRLAEASGPIVSRVAVGDRNSDSEISVIAYPLSLASKPWGTIAFYHFAEIPAAAYEGHLRFVGAVGELALEYEKQRDLDRYEERIADWRRYEQFSVSVHRDGSLSDVAFRLANDGRLFLGCDRVSVLVRDGSRYRVVCCSGVDSPDGRSNLVRNLEQLVQSVAKTHEPLYYSGDGFQLEPQIKEPLDAYVDRSAAKFLAVVPLMPPSEQDALPGAPFAALVIEQIQGTGRQELVQKITPASEHASLALHRAVTQASFPVGLILRAAKPLSTWLSRSQLPKWLWGVTAAVIFLCALLLVQIDFAVTVHGQLQPQWKQRVFAPHDGIISELLCRHGDDVNQHAVIAKIESPELELEMKRVLGELLTTRQQLASIDAERLQVTAVDSNSRQRASKLSADRLSTKECIENLEEQLEMLEQQVGQLQLTSPIHGTVLDWNPEQQLAGRPVRRGQKLFEIADLEGPWLLEFDVPDRRIGHILTARPDENSQLDLTFVLENAPGKRFHGKTGAVALATQSQSGQKPSVALQATFDREQVAAVRPGAAVVGKIKCGRRSIGYVWLHELYEELRRRFF